MSVYLIVEGRVVGSYPNESEANKAKQKLLPEEKAKAQVTRLLTE